MSNIEEKIKQAEKEHNFDICPSCKTLVPVELTFLNPDEDEEPTLIACLICGESIRII